jgi:transcriptional regulator with XRE-family HTH domain
MNTSQTVKKTPHYVDVAVGKKLKDLRKLRRMSQTDVAKLLGVSFQQIQKYETGANRISASRLYELGKIVGVSPDNFFEGIEAKTSNFEDYAEYSLVLQIVEEVLSTQNSDVRKAFVKKIAALGEQF